MSQDLAWSLNHLIIGHQLYTTQHCTSSKLAFLSVFVFYAFHFLVDLGHYQHLVCLSFYPSCMDASIAIKPVIEHYTSVVITSAVSNLSSIIWQLAYCLWETRTVIHAWRSFNWSTVKFTMYCVSTYAWTAEHVNLWTYELTLHRLASKMQNSFSHHADHFTSYTHTLD